MEPDLLLADELIHRLNALIKNEPVRRNLSQLLEMRVICSGELEEHPTVQTQRDGHGIVSVGLLGMLNGLVGVIPSGKKKGWGYITCVLDDAGWIVRFERTKED